MLPVDTRAAGVDRVRGLQGSTGPALVRRPRCSPVSGCLRPAASASSLQTSLESHVPSLLPPRMGQASLGSKGRGKDPAPEEQRWPSPAVQGTGWQQTTPGLTSWPLHCRPGRRWDSLAQTPSLHLHACPPDCLALGSRAHLPRSKATASFSLGNCVGCASPGKSAPPPPVPPVPPYTRCRRDDSHQTGTVYPKSPQGAQVVGLQPGGTCNV